MIGLLLYKTVFRFKYSSFTILPMSALRCTDLPDSTLIPNVRIQKASRSRFKMSVLVLEPSIGDCSYRSISKFSSSK